MGGTIDKTLLVHGVSAPDKVLDRTLHTGQYRDSAVKITPIAKKPIYFDSIYAIELFKNSAPIPSILLP